MATDMNSLGLSLFLLLAGITLAGSRRAAALALMAGAVYLTQAQSLDVGGAHLSAMRLLNLAGALRIALRGERPRTLQRLDVWVPLLYGYVVAVFFLRSPVDHAYVMGISIDAVLSYFVLRCLVNDAQALRSLLRGLVPLLIPFVVLLGMEVVTGRNPFAAIGGLSFTERDGRLRGMGSFRHPSLLGTLGAALAPLYIALWLHAKDRARATIGLVLCAAIIVAANSGGPVSAAVAGAVGWALWPLRQKMRLVRRALIAMLLLLMAFMKAPIWYLPAKASAFSGGDGWHRSYLMEMAFRDIGQWWLAGMDLARTRDWFDYQLSATGSADITNQYLYFGLTAGLAAMLIFLVVLTRAFHAVGQAMHSSEERQAQQLAWGLGCCVAVHVATWLGITYNFDQTYMLWSLPLAAAASLAAGVPAAAAVLPTSTAAAPEPAPASAPATELPW